MCRAKEMTAGLNLANRIQCKRVAINRDGIKVTGHHLQHFRIHNELFKRSTEAAFEPATGVIDDIGMAHNGAP